MSNSSSTINVFSLDGSTLLGGSSDGLVTSAGTWTFGAGTGGNYEILLNGQQAANGAATELVVANGGNLYAETAAGTWYDWNGSGWAYAYNPIPPQGAPIPVMTSQLVNTQPLSFALQNTQSTTLAPHEISFGEAFSDGQVAAGKQLTATINGVRYAVQLDVKTSYADGSVETGILTLAAPAIAPNTTLNAALSTITAAAASPINIANLPSSGYNVVVNLAVQNSDGSASSYQLNAGSLLSQALAAGQVTNWLQGPQVTEAQFDVPVSGSFHVTFDISEFADGTASTTVNFNNDYAMQAVGGTVTYSETITQNGAVVSQQSNITQYQYQDWYQQIWSNGAPAVNIQHNTLALEETGAVQGYDLTWSSGLSSDLAGEAMGIATAGWDTITNGTLPVDGVWQYMPATGGRGDIGPATVENALWLMTQDPTAAQYALGQADAAGSVPWNFFDPTTGNFLSEFQYQQLWAYGGLTQQLSANTGWTPDQSHQPDLSYEAYLLTGDAVYLNNLNAQAAFDILSDAPIMRDQGGYTDIVVNGQDQAREQAWNLREIDEAAYANPDGSAAKAYFTQVMDDNWAWLVSQLPNWTTMEGQAYGWIPAGLGPNVQMSPWQQDYFTSSVVEAAQMGNQDAVQVLEWQSNYLVGRFLDLPDPNDGYAYRLIVTDGSGNVLQTWNQIEAATQAAGFSNGSGDPLGGDFAELALESLAGVITVDSMYPSAAPISSLAAAMQAYGWLRASDAASTLANDVQFQIAPRLPDGNYLDQANIQIDSSSSNLTLRTTAGADSLIHAGSGADTLIAGNGTTDLLFGGSGNDVFQAGTGNAYMFGGSAANTFIAGTGNDYMQGAGIANTYVFNQNNTGQDIIGNFNTATDTLNIVANLNGNGITTAAQFLASATVDNGNTVFHLSPTSTITLLGVSTPSDVLSEIGTAIGSPQPDGDFSGSGTADFFARQDSGALLEYDMANGNITGVQDLGALGTEWSIAGVGDFNGDGTADILAGQNTGMLRVYDTANGNITGVQDLGALGNEWSIAGVGDFNGDGTADILTRQNTGMLRVYDMANGNITGVQNLGALGSDWSIAGVGDFNGDGTADILARQNTGMLCVYDMANGNITGVQDLGALGNEWSIAGVGDFNGDGTADILARQNTGMLLVYDMANGNITGVQDLGALGTDWSIAGVGDFNGDGTADILARQNTGMLSVFDMANGNITGVRDLGALGNDWSILPVHSTILLASYRVTKSQGLA